MTRIMFKSLCQVVLLSLTLLSVGLMPLVVNAQSFGDKLVLSATDSDEPNYPEADSAQHLVDLPDLTEQATLAAPQLWRPEVISASYQQFIASNEIHYGDQSRKAMALTFDCGSDVASLTNILTTLNKHQAKGTFFLEGNFVSSKPHIVPQIMAEGHEIGNHSYTHPRFTTISKTVVLSELIRTEKAIASAAGQPMPMRFFRFPYGNRTQQERDWIAELGYQSVFWDVDPMGWHRTVTASGVISTVRALAQPGSIVLMHCAADADEAALPVILTEFAAQGYRFETLSQVVGEARKEG